MDTNKAWSLAGGIGLGAGLMYLLDPLGGRRRRAWARDKVITISRKSDAAVRKTSRDVRHRAQGVITELRTRFHEEETPDNAVLSERVRSKLGRVLANPGAIQVDADNGRVTLRGSVLEGELEKLLATVAAVRGVLDVENHLDTCKEPSGVPDPEARPAPRGKRFDLFQENWSPATRFLVGAVGSGLAVYGGIRRDAAGYAMTAAGIGLLARSIANRDFRLSGLSVNP